MVDREELIGYITNYHTCENNMCPNGGCYECAEKLLKEYERKIIISFEYSITSEIKKWYFDADKQELANDSCVVDALIDLFIRTVHDTAKTQ